MIRMPRPLNTRMLGILITDTTCRIGPDCSPLIDSYYEATTMAKAP